ncbi:MAG: O-antigen ligase family protein [Deltaproteobacteria bacterium]
MMGLSLVALLAGAVTWWNPIAGIVLGLEAHNVTPALVAVLLGESHVNQEDAHHTLFIRLPVLLVLFILMLRQYGWTRQPRTLVKAPLNIIDVGLLGLGAVMLFGSLYAPDQDWGIDIAARFWVFGLPYYFVARTAVACSRGLEESVHIFMNWHWGIAVVLGVVSVMIEGGFSATHFSLWNSNPIGFSMLMGMGLLVNLYWMLERSHDSWWLTLAPLVTTPFFLFLMIGANERGPVLSTVLSAVFMAGTIARVRNHVWTFVQLLLLICALIGGALFVMNAYPEFGARFVDRLELLDSRRTIKNETRIDLYEQAINSFTRSPITGAGTGAMESKNGPGGYAHNIFLEAAAEYGLLGLIMLGIFLSGLFYYIWQSSFRIGDPLCCFFGAAALFVLCEVQFSGTLWNFKGLYFAAGMLTLLTANARRKVAIPPHMSEVRWQPAQS